MGLFSECLGKKKKKEKSSEAPKSKMAAQDSRQNLI
jgi:hypothetical protein